MPASSHSWAAARTAATIAMPKPIRVRPLGVRPSRPEADGDRRHQAADAGAELRGDERAAHEAASGPAPVGEVEGARLAVGELDERLGDDGVDRLAAVAARGDEPDLAQLAQVPRHERLRQADRLDQLGDGRRALGEDAADPQPVHVRERLVEPPQLAQVVGLDHDLRDRAADAGGGGGHGEAGPRMHGMPPSDQRRFISMGVDATRRGEARVKGFAVRR